MAARGWTIVRAIAGVLFGLLALAGLVTLVYANGFFIADVSDGRPTRTADDAAAAGVLGAVLLAVGLLVAGPVAFRGPGALFGLGLLLVVLGFVALMDGQAFRAMATEMQRLGERDGDALRSGGAALTLVGVFASVLGLAALLGFFVWYERRHARAPTFAPPAAALATETPPK